jgi:hypothetical protein
MDWVALVVVSTLLLLAAAVLYWRHRRQAQLREEVKTVLFNYYPLDDFERTSKSSLLDTSVNSRKKTGSRPTYSLPESLSL